jgi:hypothetical protein
MKRYLFAVLLAACGTEDPAVTLADASKLRILCADGVARREELTEEQRNAVTRDCKKGNGEKAIDLDLGTVEVAPEEDGDRRLDVFFSYKIENPTDLTIPVVVEAETDFECGFAGKSSKDISPTYLLARGEGGGCVVKAAGEKTQTVKVYYAPDYPLPRSLLIDIRYRFTVTDAVQ